MKNKGIILSLVGIVIVSAFIMVLVKKNSKEYIMYDGAMLALTIDGNSATSFPTDSNKYHVDIECEGGIGKYQPVRVVDSNGIETDEYEMKFTIEDITKDGVTCNIDFITITDENKNDYLLTSEVESKAQTNANGYRYSGKTPNNWVWFNNEKWRIIGSIPVCLTASCGTSTTNLVKIIRSDSIGSYAYDASTTTTSSLKGAWGENTLYSLLNTHYYASSKDTMNGQSHAGCYGYYNATYQPKPNCDYSDIGILSTSYYGRMVKNVYWNTGASANSVKAATAYTNEKSTQTVSGYIGLMSASDWGYAADSSYHSTSMSTYTNATKKATETSWIFNNGYEWTSLRYSSSTYYALYVDYRGYLSSRSADYGYAVRPVVYLDSSVYVISGSGSESDPYIIGM